MNIAVVIATYNRVKFLRKLLSQIHSARTSELSILTIVVDDGSKDGTRKMILENYPETIIINGEGNWWWTRCMNEGFKKAVEIKAEYVLIINDDNEVAEDYFEILLQDYNGIPRGSILGSMSVSAGNPSLIEMSGTKSFNRWLLKAEDYLKPYSPVNNSCSGIYPTYTLSGRGTVIPCILFHQIGYYNERLPQYGSDDEFILRARKYGVGTFISWNLKIYNHTYMTSESSSVRKTSFRKFTLNFFRPYSANSLKKEIILYWEYGVPWLLPFFILYYCLGSYKSFLFNYRKIKKA